MRRPPSASRHRTRHLPSRLPSTRPFRLRRRQTAAPAQNQADNPADAIPQTPPKFDAAYLLNPKPAYPSMSRRLGEEGRVMLWVMVEADGLPSKVEVRTSSGHARLDQAAVDAVRNWKFVPARRGSEPVSAPVIVPLSFALPR
jgi:protein TonB